jgi:hypothetical protein
MPSPGNQSDTEQSQNEPTGNSNVRGDLFLDLIINRREVYVGEPVVATAKIYTRINLSGINEIKYPSFTGFLKTDIETPPLNSLKQENVNGTIYGTGVIQRFLLYPQISGDITIDPMQLTALVQQRTGNSDPFFGDFFSSYQNIPRSVTSRAVNIRVKPLPGSKPENFSGVVGNLSIKASLEADSVNVNDAVEYKITVSGNGNLKLAEAPDLKLSPDLEVYDPKITDNIKSTINGMTGQRTFEFLLIPRHYGEYTIPSVTYSYFNPSTGRYEKLRTSEMTFYARKGLDDNSSGITVYGGMSGEDVKYVGKDIRFIKQKPGKLKRSSGIIITNRSFYSIYLISLLAFFAVLFVRREHVRRNADIVAVRNRKAGRIAVRRLREASICLKNNEMDRFHEEILKAIWGYLGDKLNIPVSNLTRNNVTDILNEKRISGETIEKLTKILDTCEYARYAPSATEIKPSELYEGASQFIRTIENSIG